MRLPLTLWIGALLSAVFIALGAQSGAIALMHRLAENSRKRWPDWAQPAAKVGISAKPAG